MNIHSTKPFLELKVIWKDDDMIELSVKAANGRYFGTTEVYDTSRSLEDFAKSLIGYPGQEKNYFMRHDKKTFILTSE